MMPHRGSAWAVAAHGREKALRVESLGKHDRAACEQAGNGLDVQPAGEALQRFPASVAMMPGPLKSRAHNLTRTPA